jgi:hypothetical protein
MAAEGKQLASAMNSPTQIASLPQSIAPRQGAGTLTVAPAPAPSRPQIASANSPPQTFAGSGQPSYSRPPQTASANSIGAGSYSPPASPPQTFAGSGQPSYSRPPQTASANSTGAGAYSPPGSPPQTFAGSGQPSYSRPPQTFAGSGQPSFTQPPPISNMAAKSDMLRSPPQTFAGSGQPSYSPPPSFAGNMVQGYDPLATERNPAISSSNPTPEQTFAVRDALVSNRNADSRLAASGLQGYQPNIAERNPATSSSPMSAMQTNDFMRRFTQAADQAPVGRLAASYAPEAAPQTVNTAGKSSQPGTLGFPQAASANSLGAGTYTARLSAADLCRFWAAVLFTTACLRWQHGTGL